MLWKGGGFGLLKIHTHMALHIPRRMHHASIHAYNTQVSPLVASFFEAPCDNAWMEWALDHYGVRTLLDTRVRDGKRLR